VTIELVYSTEKKDWLTEAVARWEATNPTAGGRPIKVTLTGMGSQAIVNGLRDGTLKPAAISPASTLQITQVNAASINGKQDIAADSQPLVFTPLVIVEVKDTVADSLKTGASLWNMVHDLTVEPDRSKNLLFGQTSPMLSNSGLQTWLLMAYSYHQKTRGLTAADINDPDFQKWLGEYAKNVVKFGDSTSAFMRDMILGAPSLYRAGTVYESTAIENIPLAKNRLVDLQVIYPPANLWSDHPFAILNDDSWVSAEQRDAAKQLRDFLLRPEQQQEAVGFGFRPSDPNVAINGADSPFVKYADQGIKTNIGELVEDPNAEVIQALLDTWNRLQGNVSK